MVANPWQVGERIVRDGETKMLKRVVRGLAHIGEYRIEPEVGCRK